MTRVIHTGDTHIGYRQYHSPVRRQDFLEAFQSVVRDAVEADVDAVVHAGDLFNDRRPDLQDLLGTISILEELSSAGIPFLAIVGNHEDMRSGQWLDLFERLDLATHLDEEGTIVGETTFYGLDYVPRSKRGQLEYEFDPPDTAHAALVSHGLFSPFPHGDWDLEEVLNRSNVDFDAVLLGDDHSPETKRVDGTWATYCGSTERTSAAERDPRGYNLVTFEEDEDVSITRKGLETRDFVFVDVELRDDEGSAIIRERIREASVEEAVVIVTVEGDGGSITPADIEQFGDEQGALVTRVNDRRERAGEDEIEVSFADPDRAVRERVQEEGFSEAALAIDDVVRDREVAESNVRDRVKAAVEDLLDEEASFQPAGTEPTQNSERSDSAHPEEEDGDGQDDAEADDATETEAEDGRQATTMEDFL
ncbi:MAG: DNA double-strand break repair protein Mre11 [Halodesulfurarchaeum sp.]